MITSLLKDFQKNAAISILIGIVFVSIVLRFYLLGINPPSLDWDEASIGYNAYSVLKTGKDEYGNFLPLSFRSFDDYKPPVYIYLTVPSVAMFSLNEFAVRFPAAFVGVLAVIVVYFLVKELLVDGSQFMAHGEEKKDRSKSRKDVSLWRVWFGMPNIEYVALLSSFFLAISPWHLQFSRAAFEGNVGMFFLICSLLFFFKGLKNYKYYGLFAVSFILSMYSYHSFRLINPIILLALVVLFWKQINKQMVWFGLALIILCLVSLPIYISFIHPEGTGARLSMVTVFSDPTLLAKSAAVVQSAKQHHDIISEILNNRRIIFIPIVIQQYFSHFTFNFLFAHGDSGVQHHSYNMGMLYLWDLPFLLIGIYFLLRNISKRISILFLIFILAPLPSAIATGAPHAVRAIAMIPEFQIFTAAGLYYAVAKISNFKFLISNSQSKFIFIGIISVLLAINVSYYFYSYYVLTPIKYGYFWQYGNKQAIEFAKQYENNYSKIIMTYAYDQPYIYYLFYNKIDPAWYQKSWNYSGTGEMQRFYRKIGKYEFMNINWVTDSKRKNTLLIGTPQEIPDGAHTEDVIYFPDGRVAYRIVGTGS